MPRFPERSPRDKVRRSDDIGKKQHCRQRNLEIHENGRLKFKVSHKATTLDIVNYYCPNYKMLLLHIQVPDKSFLISGDFNSQSKNWGYITMDRREDIEVWPYETT